MRTFPAVASSVADARSFAARALADFPAHLVEDIRLMVSELASNAIEHAMTSFHLTIHRNWQQIRVEVTDSGGGTPAMRAPEPNEVRGRGLQIVKMVATRWGVEQASDADKTVWFTIELAPMAGPTP
jgi:anti-sigma regulatory factor (Ser/Thr protein kinase)